MTIGEYVRNNGDTELAGMLLSWMLTVITLLGIDFRKLDLETEYLEIIKYLQTPMTDELVSAVEMWKTPSEIVS